MVVGACDGLRVCPISHTPCPGECVFAEVMQTGSLGVVVVDLAAERTLFANPAARAVLGDGVDVDDYDTVRALFDLGDGSRVADRGSLPGTPLQLSSRLVGHTLYRSRHFAWILLRDITEKARLEAVAEALELTNNLGYVFSAVRHELGNPINSMKVALGLLNDKVHSMPRHVLADYLQRLRGEVARIESLLVSLKTYSLHESPTPVSTDLGDVVRDFEAMYAEQYRNGCIELEVEVGPGGALASCDPRALQHVLLILVSNAADALRDRSDARVRLRVVPRGEYVVIEVVDNGPGMSPGDLKNVFAPFFTTKREGTGLGLVIARKTLSKMNGTVHLESTLGQGTVAVVSLPRARA